MDTSQFVALGWARIGYAPGRSEWRTVWGLPGTAQVCIGATGRLYGSGRIVGDQIHVVPDPGYGDAFEADFVPVEDARTAGEAEHVFAARLR